MYYCCSINLKKQSEHSGLRLDTSSLVPTFDTKVEEYLCSGWVFFFQTNFDFLTIAIFDGIFFYHSKGIVVLSSNLKRYFTCDHFS